MQRTRLLALLLGLALFGSVTAQYGDDDAYGGDEDGGYGGGGDEEPPEEDEGGPPAAGMTEELTSVEAFEAFIDNEDASVIGAFTAKEMADPAAVKPEGWDDDEDGEFEPEMITNPALAAFNQASSGLYNFRFAHTTDPDVLARLKSKAGGVYMYRSPKFSNKEAGDRPRERFPSETYVEATLGNWLKSKAQPLVGKWSYQTKERYDKAKAVVIVFFNLDFEKNAKGVNYVLKRARKVAAALQAKGVAVALGSTSDLSYEMEDFGLEVKSKASDMLMGIAAGAKSPTGRVLSAAPHRACRPASWLIPAPAVSGAPPRTLRRIQSERRDARPAALPMPPRRSQPARHQGRRAVLRLERGLQRAGAAGFRREVPRRRARAIRQAATAAVRAPRRRRRRLQRGRRGRGRRGLRRRGRGKRGDVSSRAHVRSSQPAASPVVIGPRPAARTVT